MAADLGIGLEVTGVEAAVSDLGKVKEAQNQVGQAAQQSSQRTTQAARQTVDALRSTGQQAQGVAQSINQMSSRVQGAASSIASLSSALGQQGAGRAAGLIGSLAGAVAQGAAMGAMFGPGGAVVAGLGAAAVALARLAESTTTAATAQREFAHFVDVSTGAIDEWLERASQMEGAQRRMALINQGLGSVEDQRAAANVAGREVGRIGAQLGEVRQQMRGAGSDWREYERLRTEAQRLEQELETARARSQELGRLYVESAQSEQDDQADRVSLAMDADIEAGRGAGRGARRSRAAAAERARREAAAETTRNLLGSATAGGNFQGVAGAYGDGNVSVTDPNNTAIIDLDERAEKEREASEERIQRVREQAEAQRELAVAAEEAYTSFSTGWTDSVDEVIEAWNRANEAMRQAGKVQVSVGALMGRSAVAAGNQIIETFAGKMTSAFETAVDAWLSGAKSFEEAALDMVNGVIKALVIESIVQALVETARGTAKVASSYGADPTAYTHFIAAGMWAAVGAVAGAVGAGTGAFGGGGKPNTEKGDTRELSGRSVRDEEANTQPMVFNVYPGVLSTDRQVQAAVYDALNQGARNGFALPRGR